jgi:transcriptional regulator with XRE-family HTH domain
VRTSTTTTQPENPTSQDQEVGLRIRSAREKRELTQGAVSTRTRMADPDGKGISRTSLVGYESGSSRPGLREIRLLCEVLQVTPNWIVFGSELPFQSSLPSLEWVRTGRSLRDSIRVGVAIGSLKGHERDALFSLALSLAGRQLGDLRLSGLLSYLGLIGDEIDAIVRKRLPDDSAPDSVEELVEILSQGVTSNFGNHLILDEDGDVTGGEWVYPDPKVEKPDK